MASSPSLQGPMGFSLDEMRTVSGSKARRAPGVPRSMRCCASCAMAYSLKNGMAAPAESRLAMRPRSRREKPRCRRESLSLAERDMGHSSESKMMLDWERPGRVSQTILWRNAGCQWREAVDSAICLEPCLDHL